jgi:hypothetical protein
MAFSISFLLLFFCFELAFALTPPDLAPPGLFFA